MGSVDQQIIDVTKESQGEVWNYSLKLFTSEDSDFVLKGSRNNLINTVAYLFHLYIPFHNNCYFY